MKKICFLITALISLSTFTAYANFHRYEKPFVFVENGIEFAVFNDGQFDFNILQSNQTSIHINTRNINFSFNSGHNYNSYVQYDDYGAVIQVERTPVYYDYYGRVRRIGSVNLQYNNYGFATRIGGLHINYNNYGIYYGHTGYINSYRCNYVPRHNYYCVPPRSRCVLNVTPYRRSYTPRRYSYNYHVNHYVKKPRYYTNGSSRSYRYNTSQRTYTPSRKHPEYQRSYSRTYVAPSKGPYKRDYASTKYNSKKSYTPRTYRSVEKKHISPTKRSYTPRNQTSKSKYIQKKYTPKRTYASTTRTYKRR